MISSHRKLLRQQSSIVRLTWWWTNRMSRGSLNPKISPFNSYFNTRTTLGSLEIDHLQPFRHVKGRITLSPLYKDLGLINKKILDDLVQLLEFIPEVKVKCRDVH